MEWNELRRHYCKNNKKCGKLGKVYIPIEMKLTDIGCNKWDCNKCRSNKKFNLYLDILRYVYIYNLQNHFIITFAGKNVRNICSYEESYRFMTKQWDKFRKTIVRRYGSFTYILLPRAQKDGYCHFHILTNKYMSWEWLNKKRKKYGLGYVSIQKNKDVAEYLNTDYFTESEWFIPLGIRRYRNSKNILLNSEKYETQKTVFADPKMTDEEIKSYIMALWGDHYDFNDYYEQKLISKDVITLLKYKDLEIYYDRGEMQYKVLQRKSSN